jgi:hydroxymethylpyrimidine kinase/phosphomethylpyrimidine kinase
MPTTLTIAGSDSVAGAGIQADLKTFAAFGVYGVSAVTAITAQNTIGVTDVFPLPAQWVRAQIDAVFQDVTIAAVKTGMLATGDIARTVAETMVQFHGPSLVVDPVMAATTGRTLLEPEAVSILKTQLLPMATIVTPNVAEAEMLSGMHIGSLQDAREAAKRIVELGPSAVLIKGGHLAGSDATDLLLHAGTFAEFSSPRARFGNLHGTGCTLASAIAARLALGDEVPAAVQRAKRYITGAIEQSFEAGHGARILNHFWELSL